MSSWMLPLQGLEETNLREYFRVMNRAQQAKISSGDLCPFLTYLELQQLVDEVNQKVQEDNDSKFPLAFIIDSAW